MSEVENLIQQANALHRQGRREEAETLYRQTLAAQPNHATVLAELAKIQIEDGRLDAAVELLRQTIALRPQDLNACLLLGYALLQLGRFAEAEELLISRDLIAWNDTTMLQQVCVQRMIPLLRECLSLPGDVIECGVFQGGATTQFARALRGTGKVVHACDTFAGLPDPTDADNYHHQGHFILTSRLWVESRWERFGVRPQIVVHEGLFADTLPTMQELTYCFALVDPDYYASTREALEHIYPRLSPGGWLIVDDYGWKDCAGVKVAVDEFLADKLESGDLVGIANYLHGFRKR